MSMRGRQLVLVAFACAASACASGGVVSPGLDTIRARRVELVDSKGLVRLSLSITDEDLAQVRFLGADGSPRVVLGEMLDRTIQCVWFDGSRTPRLAIGLGSNHGGGGVSFTDAQGGVRAYLGEDDSGRVAMSTFDESRRLRTSAGMHHGWNRERLGPSSISPSGIVVIRPDGGAVELGEEGLRSVPAPRGK